MKKNVLIIIGLLLITPCHAQTVIDTVSYRFIYDFQAKTYENSKQLFPDEHWLDIGKNGGSKYYSHWHALRRAVADSIRSSGGDHQDILNEYQKQGLEVSHFDYYVYKNYPEPDEQTVILSTAEYLQYDEEMGQDWELLDGDTLIMDHLCRKAQTTYHNRTWTVWYAQDIPICDGPWKLCGLPGLILAARDSKEEYIFCCIGISNHVNEPITILSERTMKTTPVKAHQTMEMIKNDFDQYLNSKYNGSFKTVVVDQKGRVTKATSVNCTFIESYK